MAVPVSKNQDVFLDITALTSEGQGIGRIDGYALFVPGALPGERVGARVIKVNTSYGIGKLNSVETRSANRVSPACPVYEKCGGCSLQHMSYAAQLEFKQRQVYDALSRIGGVADPKVLPIIGMDEPWRYRNKAAFPAGVENGRPTFGLYAARSHRLIPTDDCLIQNRLGTDALRAVEQWAAECNVLCYDETTGKGVLRHVMTRTTTAKKTMVTIVTTGALPKPARLVDILQKRVKGFSSLVHNVNAEKTNVITGKKYTVVWGEESLDERLCGLDFKVSAASFLQVNPTQTEALYSEALDFAAVDKNSTVLDLYCGIGTITLFSAVKTKEVIGVEIVEAAIDNARVNAERNNIKNARFICAPAEEVIDHILREERINPNVVIMDPPRKGCEPSVLKSIAKAGISRVVYVSCNPSTLARDVKLLTEEGYSLIKARPVDMFPQTPHVETVVLMSRVQN